MSRDVPRETWRTLLRGSLSGDLKSHPGKRLIDHLLVAFALQVLGRPIAEIRAAVPRTIELVSLSGKEDRQPEELSGGEQQRVAMARV